jgi:putative ABC transport system ATP-binding protein
MKKPVIELRNVERFYTLGEDNVVKAVNGIDLKIYEGEFVTIFGPSGCGKSTLMHVLGLLDKPTGGKILLNGKDVSKFNDNKRTELRNNNIGFVFQFFFLTPNLTAVENVELPMIFAGKDEVIRFSRAKELLGTVGLGERINHLPYQLSGGQRQRVAIARALSNEPKIILADEPTGNLDSSTGKGVVKLFKELWHKRNTLIIVTHDPLIAREAPRTIKMLDGRIVSDEKNHK